MRKAGMSVIKMFNEHECGTLNKFDGIHLPLFDFTCLLHLFQIIKFALAIIKITKNGMTTIAITTATT